MKKSRCLTYLALLFLSIAPRLLPAVDLGELTRDTQRNVSKKQRITVVWWITDDFWGEAFRQQNRLTEQQVSEFQSVMAPYTVFCVAVIDVGPMGGITGKNKDELLANVKLHIGKTVVAPLNDDQVSSDASNFYKMMKPMLASRQSMEFIIYRKDDLPDKKLDPLKRGSFEYEVFGEVVRWRLPLGSLLPKKIDPETSEEFPGNYDYSPYTGKKLQVAPPR
jgi:hypothetical protein